MEDEKQTALVITEEDFLDCNLTYGSKNYRCYFTSISGFKEEKIKIRIFSEDFLDKYEKELNFIDFKNLNKYFKLFDNLKELQNNLIELNNSKKIKIKKISKTSLDLCISVLTLNDNRVYITLDKTKIKMIEKLVRENAKMKKDIKIKDSKISQLEKELQELKLQKNIIESKLKKYEDFFELKEKRKYMDSNIFLNKEEKNLVLNQISDDIVSIKKIFDSQKDENDIIHFKKAYLNKPNLIFVIKTKKGKRFGAFASEPFLENNFAKVDMKSFLFSLDHLQIMKAKKNAHFHIWNCENNSIQFGGGTDIRIYYDFSSNKNYTIAGTYFDYGNSDTTVLNGEKEFFVDILEIFQVIL